MHYLKVTLECTCNSCVESYFGELHKFTFFIHDSESFATFISFVLEAVNDGEEFGKISFSIE